MSKGEGLIVVKSLLPFGTHWPMDARLRERASQEREVFRSWVAGLEIPGSQGQVLAELLALMDEREFVEGRAACVTYEAELARRTGLEDALQSVLVFQDNPLGVVLRIRRPGVVLTVEAAGLLWLKDSWVRERAGGLS